MKAEKRRPFKGFGERVLRLFFPPKCFACGDLLLGEGELCPQCLLQWERARRERCPVCSKTARGCTCATFHLPQTDMLGERRMLALAFYSKFGSDDPKDNLVLRLVYSVKTSSDRSAARLCARELSAQILKALALEGERAEDYKITYPPRSRKRVKRYGFDHGRVLAEAISEYTGMPVEDTLVNLGKTAQKSLNAQERRINAQSSYVLKRNVPLHGKYIVVDDVITTGATVNAAALALKSAGAESVFPVCIARSKRKKRRLRRPAESPWFQKR